MPSPRLSSLLAALRDPKRWMRWLGELLILGAIVAAVTAWQNRGLPEGAAPPLAGLRNDGVFEDLAKKVGTGKTATLVVFWATWCPVCRAEHGNIDAVAQDWPVVAVALDSGDAAEVTQYLKQHGILLPSILDDDSTLARAWRVRGVPAHFIVDPAGNIRFRAVGYGTTLGLRARLWRAQHVPL